MSSPADCIDPARSIDMPVVLQEDAASPSAPPRPSPPPCEVELKLRLAPECVRAVTAALGRAATAPGRAKTLNNTYFDTPDGLLLRRGATLRLRRLGRAHLQTLKGPADSRGGALSRAEWEMPAPGGHLRLDLFTDPAARALLEGAHPCDLKPLFTSTIHRRVFPLPLSPDAHPPGAGAANSPDPNAPGPNSPGPNATAWVEACVDVGVIQVAGRPATAVCELELELCDSPAGDPAPLYNWALALNMVAPLAVETRSKAERGYAAAGLDGPAPAAPPLAPHQPAGSAFAALLRRGLAQWARAEDVVRQAGPGQPPPEGVHQMRVALRRLRSCIALFRPLLDDQETALTLAHDLGILARDLGAARAWDVFHDDLLAPVAGALPGHPALAAAMAAADAQRAGGYQRVRTALATPGTAALRLRLARWIDATDWAKAGLAADPLANRAAGTTPLLTDPIKTVAAHLLRRRWRAVERRARHFADQDAPARHDLRIAIKKLRYATEFFRDLLPARATRAFLDRLAEAQDRLGHLNDVATLEAMIAEMGGAPDSGPQATRDWRLGMGVVLGWHVGALHSREHDLRAAIRAVVEAGPPPFP